VIRYDLTADIQAVLGPLAAVYTDSATESDLYEASLFALCVSAAERAGGTVLLTDDGTSRVRRSHFRRSPGNLWSGAFTYALVHFGSTGKKLEIHLGVKVTSSRSGVAHECDVALISHKEARWSRKRSAHPRSKGGLIAAIEAKHYSLSPSLGVGRGFLGLAYEMMQKKFSLVFPAHGNANLLALAAKRPCRIFDAVLPGTRAAVDLDSHLVEVINNWNQPARPLTP
jgi:hypothetical protein